jgi:uncharacterized protein (TIGR04222 family)
MPRPLSRALSWGFAAFTLAGSLTGSLGGSPTGSTAPTLPGSERISNYAVDLRLTEDDVLHVRETIDYDFGATYRHGIDRWIPVEFKYGKDQFREFPIDKISVSSPSGAPAQLRTTGRATIRIRIGDLTRTVTDKQTYVISYDVAGVVNSFSDHQELFWNATGTQWKVLNDATTVTVEGPSSIQKVACYNGESGSRSTCLGKIDGAGAAHFTSGALPASAGVTVVAAFPVGSFPNAAPILKQRGTWLAQAFSLTALTVGASLALFALLSGAVIIPVLRRGRLPWRRRDPVAVQFSPPQGVRPAELGMLMDERVRDVHITATIIDLAVRGYFTIDEVVKPRKTEEGTTRGDWKLTRQPGRSLKELRDYEAQLYGALFAGGKEVRLSRLTPMFGTHLRRARTDLEDGVMSRGWFRARPSKVRATWTKYGLVMLLIGVGLTWLLAARTSYGLLGLAVLAAGIVVLLLAPRMSARSAAGTALLTQTRGFRLYLEKAEPNQIRFEEGEDVYSRHLAFAITFEVAERWAAAFGKLAAAGVAVPVPAWSDGQMLLGFWAMNNMVNDFSGGFDSAPSGSSSATSATSGSSGLSGLGNSGGSSGGGAGGGGGGSW